MDLPALIRRRTVRSYLPETVPDETLRRIVDLARWTGSARNRQPWRFVAVRDDGVRRELATLGAYAGHLAAAPVVLVVLSPAEQRLDTELDVGRVLQSLTLAASDAGLGSCVTSLYPEDRSVRAATLVGAPEGWVARHALALGYAAPPAFVGRSAIPGGRLPVEELLRFR